MFGCCCCCYHYSTRQISVVDTIIFAKLNKPPPPPSVLEINKTPRELNRGFTLNVFLDRNVNKFTRPLIEYPYVLCVGLSSGGVSLFCKNKNNKSQVCFWIYQASALDSINRCPVFLNARGTNNCWFVAVRSGYLSVFCIMSWNV